MVNKYFFNLVFGIIIFIGFFDYFYSRYVKKISRKTSTNYSYINSLKKYKV